LLTQLTIQNVIWVFATRLQELQFVIRIFQI
jgi:hypothetical protein